MGQYMTRAYPGFTTWRSWFVVGRQAAPWFVFWRQTTPWSVVSTFIYLLRRFVSENDDRAVVYPRDDVRLVHLLVRYNVNINTRQQMYV